MNQRMLQKLRRELTILRREIPLPVYLFWWLCRLAMITVTVLVVRKGGDAGHFRLQMIANTALTFVLPELHLLPRSRFTLARLPYRAQTAACLMVVITCILGNHLNVYGRLWWFDTFVHLLAGAICVPMGVDLITAAANGKERLSPLMASVAGFGLSCFTSLAWECYEFLFDWFCDDCTQNWRGTPVGPLLALHPTDPLRFPLYDTMSDLLAGLLGALLTAVGLRILRELREKKALQSNRSRTN